MQFSPAIYSLPGSHGVSSDRLLLFGYFQGVRGLNGDLLNECLNQAITYSLKEARIAIR